MINYLKQVLTLMLNKLSWVVFNKSIGNEMKLFLKNLSWSFIGGFISAGILFLLNIAAGRIFGPETYGSYSLVLITGQIILIPMIFGQDLSVARYLSKNKKNSNLEVKIISSAFWLVVLFTIPITILIISILRTTLLKVFSVSSDVLFWGTIYGIILTIKLLFDGIIKGLFKFKFQAIGKIIESIIVVITFLVLFLRFSNYLTLLVSITFSGIILIIIYLIFYIKYIRKPYRMVILNLINYGRFVFIGSILSLFLVYGDRYVINRFLGIKELGLYSAYYTSTIFMVGQLISILNNVFYPLVVKIKNNIMLLKKIDHLIKISFLPLFIMIVCVGYLVMKLFGKLYDLNYFNLILFCIIATLQVYVSLYANIVNAHNEKSYSKGILFLLFRSIGYFIYIVLLAQYHLIAIPTILFGLILNYVLDILNLRYIIKKYA